MISISTIIVEPNGYNIQITVKHSERSESWRDRFDSYDSAKDYRLGFIAAYQQKPVDPNKKNNPDYKYGLHIGQRTLTELAENKFELKVL